MSILVFSHIREKGGYCVPERCSACGACLYLSGGENVEIRPTPFGFFPHFPTDSISRASQIKGNVFVATSQLCLGEK